MKRAVRWIGIAVTAAAAATMLLADLALAAPPVEVYVMRFDLLSPGGLSCTVDAPAGSRVTTSRDLTGKPYIRIWGEPRAAAITCTDPQGVRWQATAQRTARFADFGPTYGIVLYRPGRDAMTTIVQRGDQQDTYFKTFVRVD
ncbi:hypothetical protein [Paracoccus luteus]|uniref:hypothetical protein n=1 Tax=Paracoccus luteus TaxID=2508543 RepID=UPI001431B270|nr:hypothetical protein [Paracoccus luteus]